MGDAILVADDDQDILRFVELNLRLEGFDIFTAPDGEHALELARQKVPAMVILDVMMPKMDGYEVCQALRNDGRTSHICIIMLTARSMSADKVLGLTAGADGYISKPFDPMELVARVKATLRRTREMRAVSPLTGLPGNVQIENEMRRRFNEGKAYAVLWLDLDNFKAFNDRYGFSRGDDAINYLADTLREITGEIPDAFLGHIGGDDFVVITNADDAEVACNALVERFDGHVRALYDREDALAATISVKDRLGNLIEFPLLSVSIGAATNEHRVIIDHRELVQTATEMKEFAKQKPGSVYAIDRRGRPQDGA